MTITNSGANKIVIIDNYTTKTVDIDGDNKPDITHGEAVEKMFFTKQPNAEIIRYNAASDTEPGNLDAKKMASAYEDISKRIDQGEKIDGVNMSVGADTRIGFLDRFIDDKLTAKNISGKEDQLKNSGYKKILETGGIQNVINNIEKVTSKNVPVYIAGGNAGPDYFNNYGFANGVTQVGANGLNGKKHPDSANNSSIARWAQGEFEITSIKDAAGKISGYDYTGDGKVDLLSENATGKGSLDPKGSKLFGTSLSSPFALSEDVIN